MDINHVTDALKKIISGRNPSSGRQLVFWYDGEGEFENLLPEIKIDGLRVIRMDTYGTLELKILLEQGEFKEQSCLLYAPSHEPPYEDDWLLDIKLFSYVFHADKASMVLGELKLETPSMRLFLGEHLAFFRNRERLERVRKWVVPTDQEEDLLIKMIAAITRAEQPEAFAILLRLLESCCQNDHFITDKSSGIWEEIEKFKLDGFFWTLMGRTFGYVHANNPGIPDLVTRLLVTEFDGALNGECPPSIAHFVIEGASAAMNVAVFLSQWRSNMNYYRHYNVIAPHICSKLNIGIHVGGYEIEALMPVMTFDAVEKRIISCLRDRLINNGESAFDEFRDIIGRRLDGYWTTVTLHDADGSGLVNLYRLTYQALDNASRLFELRKNHDEGLGYPDMKAIFRAYTEELYRFDQYYRWFNVNADAVETAGWDVLKALREAVENCYSGWFLDQIGLAWGDLLDGSDFFQTWTLPGYINQHEFYRNFVAPVLKQPRNRAFVIISDAFRFEAAAELVSVINGKYRLRAELKPMIGVLPGFTALGMAALLPHKRIGFKTEGIEPLVDDQPVASTDQRAQFLAAMNGTAIKADDLMAMSKDQGRAFVKPHRLIYIYHDRIDATGEKAASETRTFQAVQETIDELYGLISFIINSLNGTRLFVTADHGFLYHDRAPDAVDKSTLDKDIQGAIKKNKRFVLGRGLTPANHTFHGGTNQTAGTSDDLSFLIPRGANRFNFSGGARFFHGGAMPQEMVVPVVTVTEMKGKHLSQTEVRKVDVSLLGSVKKIVTNIPRFKFIQTDAVSDRVRPRTLNVSLRDGQELISNEEMITFDSESTTMDERTRTVKLNLKAVPYDNKSEYHLVLRNADDDTEYDRLPIVIDLAFANDF
jgi:uncharacterized protein (TIGR02687 family)